MADPTKYTRQTDYSPAALADLRSDLNPEFDALVVSVDEIVEAIKNVRASDGGMVNGIVDFDALDSATQDKITTAAADAAAEAANAEASATAAANSASDAADSATDAQLAQAAAETAQAAAELAEGNAEAAQSLAETARDTAQAHRDDALGYSNTAFLYRNEAEAAANSAADAVRKAPNDVAATVFVNGRDWGVLSLNAPFSNEEIPGVRVDLARGSSSIDLGGVV